MSTPLIKLENVDLYYDRGRPSEVHALKNVSLEIEKGEYVAFFGPSGCGKTTLLYVIAGIESGKVTAGKTYINGRDITHLSKRELAIFRQIGVGIIFQQFNLIPSISVLDNVALPMSLLGISLARRKEEALKLLDRLGIKNLANRMPSELSGGQQQRVGIARALANNPPLIVADEPLGNLDSENAEKVLEFLKELNEKDGRTVIMVTHEAWSLKDVQKIFYMKDGEITKAEKPKSGSEMAKALSKHLYKELYPELSERERVARSLSHLFLKGYSADEVKRFEFYLFQRLENKIDKQVFMAVLDRPFKQGGVGLWRPRAEKIANMVEALIEQKSELDEIREMLKEDPAVSLQEEVSKIRNWLLQEYSGKITALQKMQVDELVGERIRNIIGPEHFKKALNISKKDFGVGFSRRTSQNIAEKMESLVGGQAGNNFATYTPG